MSSQINVVTLWITAIASIVCPACTPAANTRISMIPRLQDGGHQAATFHVLRHTYASALAVKGASMRVITDQLRHFDTPAKERHYARLTPRHAVTSPLDKLGLFMPEQVAPGG